MLNIINKKQLLLFILLAFFVSVLVRWPHFNRPFGKYEHIITQELIRTLDIWDREGAENYNYNLVMNYNTSADKNINNHGRLADRDGNWYYASFPPFSWIAPYLVFKFLNVAPSELSIRIYALFFHFVACLYLFLIIKETTQDNSSSLLGLLCFLFSPITLWGQSIIYAKELFVIWMFIGATYHFVKSVNDDLINKNHFFCFLIFIFIMCYTEWLGFLYSASIFSYCLLKEGSGNKRKILFFTTVAAVFSLLLTLYQYSKIAGWRGLSVYLLSRGSDVAGLDPSSGETGFNYGIKTIIKILDTYIYGYLPILILLFTLMFFYYKFCPINTIFLENESKIKKISFILLTPVLFEYLFLPNHMLNHSFTVIYSAPFICYCIALICFLIKNNIRKKNYLNIVTFLVFSSLVLSVLQYHYTRRFVDYSSRSIGEEIGSIAKHDEVVFLNSEAHPAVIYYAKRNIANYKNLIEAKKLIEKNSLKKGIVFYLSEDGNEIMNFERIII